MSDAKNEMIWGVVHCGVLTFIGAFYEYDTSQCKTVDEAPVGVFVTRENVRERIVADFGLGKVMKLSPVMELAAPLQQVRQQAPEGQRVGVAKSPLPMPYGFTTGQAHLVVRPDAIAFIDEMSKDDQRLYQSFIKSVREAETAERASRSGLTLIKGGLDG